MTEIVEEAAAGRRGVGTTNHCVHGKDAVVEEILDWRPSEYFTLNWQMPIPGCPKVKTTYELTGTDEGTAVAMRMERPRSTKDRAFLEQMLPGLAPIFEAGIAALTPLVADEMARRASESDAVPEPALPESGGAVPRGSCRFDGGLFVVALTAALAADLIGGRHAVRVAHLHAGARLTTSRPRPSRPRWTEYNAFTAHLRERGTMLAGEALDGVATATTVRVVDGRTITTDGPFAETKETLGGFYLVEAADLDEAIA